MKRIVSILIAVAVLAVLVTAAPACDHAAFTAGCAHCQARIVAAPVYQESSRLNIEVAPGGYTQRYVERIQTPVMREYVTSAEEVTTTTTTTTTKAPVRAQLEEAPVVYRLEQAPIVYRLTEPSVVYHLTSRQNFSSGHCQQNLRQNSTFQLRQRQQFNSQHFRQNLGSGAQREEIREFKGVLGARRRVEIRQN